MKGENMTTTIRLRNYRTDLALTEQQLAERLGVPLVEYLKWEAREACPFPKMLELALVGLIFEKFGEPVIDRMIEVAAREAGRMDRVLDEYERDRVKREAQMDELIAYCKKEGVEWRKSGDEAINERLGQV
jgi:transcriptional regulator with XRE-family HTH domain